MAAMFHPTRDIDYRDAVKVLRRWLKAQGLRCGYCQQWARWTYSDIPFWSTWTYVVGPYRGKITQDVWGMHIYDDGRVLIVANDQETLRDVNGETK